MQPQSLHLTAWIATQNDPRAADRAQEIAADIQQFWSDEENYVAGSSTDVALHWLICD